MDKKPKLIFNSTGQSGNIFWILGAIVNLLGRNRASEIHAEIKENAQNYKQALDIISKYVELEDNPHAI